MNKVGGNIADVTVDFFTTDGTGVAGADYTSTNGPLTFTTNDFIHLIPISIIDNAVINGAKTFTMTLSNPSAGTFLATNTSALVTIYDDDDRAVVGEWEDMVSICRPMVQADRRR